MMWRVLVIAAIVATGCTSPFVGRWQTNNVAEVGLPSDACSLTLVINKDHTFAAMFQDRSGAAVAGYNGRWESSAKTQILLKPTDGPRGSAQLLDPETILATGDGVAFKLTRTQ